jgi:hypothetical protein
MPAADGPSSGSVTLYWIPLGAGQQVARLFGALYEALTALVQRRPRGDIYHAALVVTTSIGPVAI